MTRDKSQLIIKVPFYALSREDKEKVKQIDARYSTLCSKCDGLSWQQLRRKIKPYTIFVTDSSITIMTGTKKNAVAMSGFKPKDITKIIVEYVDRTEELTLPKTAKPKCKLQ